MIFMALNIVLEIYFEDVLSLVDQSSVICDEILGCWFLLFNIFLWIIQIKQIFFFFAYDVGALQLWYQSLGYDSVDTRDQVMILQTHETRL